MISDEKRREVAESLRNLDDETIALMKESGEQHMSSKAVEEVIVDDNGRRWVREGAALCTSWADGVPAPVDADGDLIRIGDVLYLKGSECRVVSITVKADEACVGVHTDDGVFLPSVNPKYLSRKNPEPLEPEPADSWERLEADVERLANCYDVCDYFDATGRKAHDCGNEDGFCCDLCVARDILRRAKAIAVRGKGE